MTAKLLCLALTLASETFAPLPAKNLELACQQADHLIETAEEQGIDPTVMAGLIYVESRWTPDAVSRSGACGLTQVIPRYVDESCKELKNPETSIKVGTASLKKWTTMRVRRKGKLVRVPRTGGMKTALACYNAGNVCAGSSQGRHYANAVLRYAKRLENALEEVTPKNMSELSLPVQEVAIPVHPIHENNGGEHAFYQPLLGNIIPSLKSL